MSTTKISPAALKASPSALSPTARRVFEALAAGEYQVDLDAIVDGMLAHLAPHANRRTSTPGSESSAR